MLSNRDSAATVADNTFRLLVDAWCLDTVCCRHWVGTARCAQTALADARAVGRCFRDLKSANFIRRLTGQETHLIGVILEILERRVLQTRSCSSNFRSRSVSDYAGGLNRVGATLSSNRSRSENKS
jgi:hypothetical protein